MLMVDEAHAIGVFGERGRGVVEHFSAGHPGFQQQVHMRVGSFGKALGSAGGFRVRLGRARAVARQSCADLRVFDRAPGGNQSRRDLWPSNSWTANPSDGRVCCTGLADLRDRLNEQGWDTGHSVSQIIPVVLGSAERTMQVSAGLRERGIWAPGIRPPSVPEGQSLLRLGFTASHTEEMVERLLSELAKLRQ